MTPVRDLSLRELLYALAQVEDAIRQARLPPAPTTPAAVDVETEWADIGALAAYEQEIVSELRRRRRLANRIGFDAVDTVGAPTV
jgi:hypothetical protein